MYLTPLDFRFQIWDLEIGKRIADSFLLKPDP